jgi:hypothetical protein
MVLVVVVIVVVMVMVLVVVVVIFFSYPGSYCLLLFQSELPRTTGDT